MRGVYAGRVPDRLVRINLFTQPPAERLNTLLAHPAVLRVGRMCPFWAVVLHIPGCDDDRTARLIASELLVALVPEWATRPPAAVSVFEPFGAVSEDDLDALVERMS